MHIDMSKKDKNKKAKPSTKLELFFTIVPVLLAVLFLWRSIPDGIYRLDLGQSDVGEKAIALTFDDGPSGHTERLLDGLKHHNQRILLQLQSSLQFQLLFLLVFLLCLEFCF